MKKLLALSLCVAMLLAFASCTAAKSKKPVEEIDITSLKTMGDLFRYDVEDGAWSYNEEKFVALYTYGEKTYRVYADFTKEIYDAMEAIDFFDEDKDEKTRKALSGAKITLAEDMDQYLPTEEYLQQYVGKTGQELLDDDFWSSGYNLYGEQTIYMGHDLYEFEVYFNEKIEFDENDMDDFDEEEAIKDLTVKKLVFTDFSSRATDFD